MEPVSFLIGSAISLGSGLIGWLMERGAVDEAQRIVERAQAEYGNLDPLTLERIAYEELGPSAMESIKVDPTYKEAQLAALDRLQSIADSGGMTLEDRAAQNAATGEAQRAESAGFNRILNQMDAEGAGSSGSRLALLFGNQQAAADRYSDTALDTAATAQRRALDAILARGDLAGGMRDQEFGEQSQIAQARDAIARYNADVSNRAIYHNAYTAPMAEHQSRVGLADRRYGMARDQANLVAGRGADDRRTIAGVGQAIGGGITYAGQQGMWPWQASGANSPESGPPDVAPPKRLYESSPMGDFEDEEDPWRYS